MYLLYTIVIFLLGFVAPVQTSINSEASRYIGSPVGASLYSFLSGTVALLIIVLIAGHGLAFPSSSIQGLPWWAWLGGAAGVLGITVNILLLPRLGSIHTVIMPLVGQVTAGFVIDAFGLFDTDVRPFSLFRAIGFILIIAGVFFAVVRKGASSYPKNALGWQLLGIVAGAALAMQPAMNSRLGTALDSPLRASLFSFASGAVLLLLIMALSGTHRPYIGKVVTAGRPAWDWLGGLIGVCIVIGQTYLVSYIGVGLLTILNIFGMLASGALIDHFGLLNVEKRPVTGRKLLGLTLVLAGIIILNV